MAPDRQAGVFGATGSKAALLPEKRAQGDLVQADQGYQELLSHPGSPSFEMQVPKKLAVETKFGYNTPSSTAHDRAEN